MPPKTQPKPKPNRHAASARGRQTKDSDSPVPGPKPTDDVKPVEKPKPSARIVRSGNAGLADTVSHTPIGGTTWTGKTPKQLLYDYCAKHKMGKPLFESQIGKAGFKGKVTIPATKGSGVGDKVFDTMETRYEEAQDAQHRAAVFALHQISGLPLQRVMEPKYRETWQQAADAAQAAKSKSAKKTPKSEQPSTSRAASKSTDSSEEDDDDEDEDEDEFNDESDDADDVRLMPPREKVVKAPSVPQSTSISTSGASAPPVVVAVEKRRAETREEYLARKDEKYRQRQSRREALNLTDTNAPLILSLSDRCRTLIEQTLREVRGGHLLPLPPKEAGSLDRDTHQRFTAQLKSFGFASDHIDRCLRCLPANAKLQQALDWLCVNLPDSELPKGFGKEHHLELVVNDRSVTAEEYTESSGDELQKSLAATLAEYGFDRRWTRYVSKRCQNDPNEALVMLLRAYRDHFREDAANDLPPSSLSEEEMEDEAMALQAIYGDQIQYRKEEMSGQTMHVFDYLFTTPEGSGRLITFADYTYPQSVPLILLHRVGLKPALWLSCMKCITAFAETLRGSSMMFSLINWLTESEGMATVLRYAPGASHPPLPKPSSLESKMSSLSLQQQQSPDRRRRNERGPQRSRQHREMSDSEAQTINRRLQQEMADKLNDEKYITMQKTRSQLPTYQMKDTVVGTINKGNVTVISGETGCGKSTQVPQLILDDAIQRSFGAKCRIICTQPRRVAALSLAARVADERAENVGHTVGYAIRGEKKQSVQHTRLLFCTTGILLRMLTDDNGLDDVTHIVVDEVHERSVDSDFLLLVLRRYLRTGVNLKVILMSATADAKLFSDYFDGAPMVTIPGRIFPVDEFYLKEICKIIDYTPEERYKKKPRTPYISEVPATPQPEKDAWDEDDGSISKNTLAVTSSDLKISTPFTSGGGFDDSDVSEEEEEEDNERIDTNLIEALCAYIHNSMPSGAILVFMPGIVEISDLCRRLARNSKLAGTTVLPLHSGLQPKDQKRVFEKVGKGGRKIVVATNIAETSITIDDVVYVIDTGKVREMQYDPARHLSMLVEAWVSQASATQRKGRAGRVQRGICYRLFSAKGFKKMQRYSTPEMCRTSLHQLCLEVKILNLGAILPTLMDAITPPEKEAIMSSISLLMDVGAMTKQEDLTPLGKHLAALPVDVRIGKLALYGCVLRCADTALTMASLMATRSPFVMPIEKREEAHAAHMKFGTGKSDHIAAAAAYAGWMEASVSNRGREYADEHFLSEHTLKMAMELKQQLAEELSGLGFLPHSVSMHKMRKAHGDGVAALAPEFCKYNNDGRVVRAVLCASMYPNVVRVKRPKARYHEVMGGAVQKRDKPHELKLYTKVGERVTIHPTSTNACIDLFESPCTMVGPYALMLFGGDIEVRHAQGRVVVDGWVTFSAQAKFAVLIRELRTELATLLQTKIERPETDISSSPVGEAILQLLVQ